MEYFAENRMVYLCAYAHAGHKNISYIYFKIDLCKITH